MRKRERLGGGGMGIALTIFLVFFNQLEKLQLVFICALFAGSLIWTFSEWPSRANRDSVRVCRWIILLFLAVAASALAAWIPWTRPQPHSYLEITTLRLHPTEAPPYVEYVYRNGGPIPADKVAIFPRFQIGPFPRERSGPIDAMYSDFVKDFNVIAESDYQWRDSLGPGSEKATWHDIPIVTNEEVNQLLAGTGDRFAYFMGGIVSVDSVGLHRKGFCYYMVPINNRILFHADHPMDVFGNWHECHPSDLKKWEESIP